jgi:hypothetical protein
MAGLHLGRLSLGGSKVDFAVVALDKQFGWFAGRKCRGCPCVNCLNTTANSDGVEARRQHTLAKDPTAFDVRFVIHDNFMHAVP